MALYTPRPEDLYKEHKKDLEAYRLELQYFEQRHSLELRNSETPIFYIRRLEDLISDLKQKVQRQTERCSYYLNQWRKEKTL